MLRLLSSSVLKSFPTQQNNPKFMELNSLNSSMQILRCVKAA